MAQLLCKCVREWQVVGVSCENWERGEDAWQEQHRLVSGTEVFLFWIMSPVSFILQSGNTSIP